MVPSPWLRTLEADQVVNPHEKTKQDRKFNLHVLTFAMKMRDNKDPRLTFKGWGRAIMDFELIGRWSKWVISSYLRSCHLDCCICGSPAIYRFSKEGFCSSHKAECEKRLLHSASMRDGICHSRWQERVSLDNPHIDCTKRPHRKRILPPVPSLGAAFVPGHSDPRDFHIPAGSLKGDGRVDPNSGLPFE